MSPANLAESSRNYFERCSLRLATSAATSGLGIMSDDCLGRVQPCRIESVQLV